MKKIIHHIKRVRKQPEEVRRHILHVTTFIFAIILFSLWVVSLGYRFTSNTAETDDAEDIEPLSAIKENFLGGYNSLREE